MEDNKKVTDIVCSLTDGIPRDNDLELSEYRKESLALELYKERATSLVDCASVAEMTKEEFIKFLGTNRVSIFSFSLDEEFLEELKNA